MSPFEEMETNEMWIYLLPGHGKHGVEEPDGDVSVVHVEELLVELHGVEAAQTQSKGAPGSFLSIWEKINFSSRRFGPGGYKGCRLSLLTNSALVCESHSQCGGMGGEVAGSQPTSTAVHITWHGAQINFGIYLHILTYGSVLVLHSCAQILIY